MWNQMPKWRVCQNGQINIKCIHEQIQKSHVAHVLQISGYCIPFWITISSLRVMPSFACSVSSLSRCPGHSPPGVLSLHEASPVGYPLVWGNPSARCAKLEKFTYAQKLKIKCYNDISHQQHICCHAKNIMIATHNHASNIEFADYWCTVLTGI